MDARHGSTARPTHCAAAARKYVAHSRVQPTTNIVLFKYTTSQPSLPSPSNLPWPTCSQPLFLHTYICGHCGHPPALVTLPSIHPSPARQRPTDKIRRVISFQVSASRIHYLPLRLVRFWAPRRYQRVHVDVLDLHLHLRLLPTAHTLTRGSRSVVPMVSHKHIKRPPSSRLPRLAVGHHHHHLHLLPFLRSSIFNSKLQITSALPAVLSKLKAALTSVWPPDSHRLYTSLIKSTASVDIASRAPSRLLCSPGHPHLDDTPTMCTIVRRYYSCGNVIEQRYHGAGCSGSCVNPKIETMHHAFVCDDAGHAH